MDPKTQKQLEGAGWQFGDAEDFLGLNDAERRLVDLRVKLGTAVRRLRAAKKITQKGLAMLLETSQARVVDIEASVGSLDSMFRAFYVLGGEQSDLDALGAPLTPSEQKSRVTSRTVRSELVKNAHPKSTRRRKAIG